MTTVAALGPTEHGVRLHWCTQLMLLAHPTHAATSFLISSAHVIPFLSSSTAPYKPRVTLLLLDSDTMMIFVFPHYAEAN